MATVQIEGTMSDHFAKGIRVTEQDGTYSRRWTVWTDERPDKGTAVTVTAILGTKPEPGRGQHEGKTFVEHHANKPVSIIVAGLAGAPGALGAVSTAATPAATRGDDWWGTSDGPVF